MSKLLNKPLKVFALYSLIILICSIPVYYWVVDYIWLSELDDHNSIVKTRLKQQLENGDIDEDRLATVLNTLNNFEPGLNITPSIQHKNRPDSIYTITKKANNHDNEIDRYRGLKSSILINNRPYILTIETNVEEADETLLAIAAVTFLFFVLLIGGFIMLNKRISDKIWQPFRVTLNKLKQFDINKTKEIQFSQSDILEFEELNHELTRLIKRNSDAFQQQKTFIENASHELQTPIALLKSKVDFLYQQKGLSKEQWSLIESINLSLSKLSRINKNLLLLAKIENFQFADNSTVDIGAVLNENLELLSDYIAGKKIKLETVVNGHFSVLCNKTLLEILINNLLINAIYHNSENGEIVISLTQNTLSVSNSGKKPLNEENIFKRFAVSSSKATSSGLGLAIVKEISTRYGWEVVYSFGNNQHTFSVTFH